MKIKSYRLFEGLRVAMLLTFVSGYIDAFSFQTQGKRFAAVQTGNLIYFAMALAENDWQKVLDYAIPLLVFSLGQFINYFIRKKIEHTNLRWHAFSSHVMLFLLLITVIGTPFWPPTLTLIFLTLYASIQVDTFKRLRGAPYGNVMMTGNIKNAANTMVRGLATKQKKLVKESLLIYAIMASFILGIVLSMILTAHMGENALFLVLIPIGLLNIWLVREKI